MNDATFKDAGRWMTTQIRIDALRAVCQGPVSIRHSSRGPVKPYPDGIHNTGALQTLTNSGLAIRTYGSKPERADTWTATDLGRGWIAEYDRRQNQRTRKAFDRLGRSLRPGHISPDFQIRIHERPQSVYLGLPAGGANRGNAVTVSFGGNGFVIPSVTMYCGDAAYAEDLRAAISSVIEKYRPDAASSELEGAW